MGVEKSKKMFEKFPQKLWLNDTKLSISDYASLFANKPKKKFPHKKTWIEIKKEKNDRFLSSVKQFSSFYQQIYILFFQ